MNISTHETRDGHTVYKHTDIDDLTAFDLHFQKRRTGYQDLYGKWWPDDNIKSDILAPDQAIELKTGAVVNVGEYGSDAKMGTFGKNYQLVNHLDYFAKQNEALKNTSNLNCKDVQVIDNVYEHGAKVQRSIHFLEHTKTFGGRDEVCLRSDTFNSVDQSWMFQQFIGAYRDLCRNTLVFGGERTFHTKRKHTNNLSISSVIGKSGNALELFSSNMELLDKLRSVKCSEQQAKTLFSQTLCARKHRPSEDTSQPVVNKRLLDYLIYRFREDRRDLGENLWLVYNCLTHWSTHTNESFEREYTLPKGGYKVVQVNTGRADQKVHNIQRNRQSIVSQVLLSNSWKESLERVAA